MSQITYSLREWRGRALSKDDFMRKYLFAVTFDKIPSGIQKKFDDVIYFISKTKTPKSTTEVITVPWMNSEIKIPGITKFENWSVTVRDTKDGHVYQFLQSWRELMFAVSAGFTNLTDGISYYPNDVIGEATVHLLTPKGEVSQLSFTLHNVFITDLDEIDLSLGDNGIVEFGATFAYDYFTVSGSGSA